MPLGVSAIRGVSSDSSLNSLLEKGYLREADVIKFMEVNGFEYVGSADTNANPKDPANHAEGVWEMKPSWRTKRPELENLGETDRMTLLFRKRA